MPARDLRGNRSGARDAVHLAWSSSNSKTPNQGERGRAGGERDRKIAVTLTSSVAGVASTEINFTIPQGTDWYPVNFTSTYQVGTTQLTASAQDILPVQTSLVTYGSVPSQVIVSAISSNLPADGASHQALELSLEDALGNPAPAGSRSSQ